MDSFFGFMKGAGVSPFSSSTLTWAMNSFCTFVAFSWHALWGRTALPTSTVWRIAFISSILFSSSMPSENVMALNCFVRSMCFDMSVDRIRAISILRK